MTVTGRARVLIERDGYSPVAGRRDSLPRQRCRGTQVWYVSRTVQPNRHSQAHGPKWTRDEWPRSFSYVNRWMDWLDKQEVTSAIPLTGGRKMLG